MQALFSIGAFILFIFLSTSNDFISIKADENGYIWGQTNDFHSIAIYTGKSIDLQFGAHIVNTWHYIVFYSRAYSLAPDKQLFFNAIKFENGAIRSVNPCNALQEDFDKEHELNAEQGGRYYVYKEHDASKDFSVSDDSGSNDSNDNKADNADNDNNRNIADNKNNDTNKVTQWIFTSKIERKMSIEEGDILKNDTSALLIKFNEAQPLNVFIDYYKRVINILAFLTFRQNISFDDISLEYTIPGKNMTTVADCYIKPPAVVENRSVVESIGIKTFDDIAFANLIKSAYELPTSIIPEDANAVYKMSADIIKNVCSLLEVECDNADIKLNKESDLEELIESVKAVIKNHQKEKNTLGKTYSVLFGSIRHWSDSLADKISIAYAQHKKNMQPMLAWRGVVPQDQDIVDLVKARNALTHRAMHYIDENVRTTAFMMYGLIYCMVLKRLGLGDNIIAGIMGNRFIG